MWTFSLWILFHGVCSSLLSLLSMRRMHFYLHSYCRKRRSFCSPWISQTKHWMFWERCTKLTPVTWKRYEPSFPFAVTSHLLTLISTPQSYPVHHLIRETTTNSLMATKGFSAILKLVWQQTKPIFIAPYLDSTAKLCFMVFTLFAVGHGTLIW